VFTVYQFSFLIFLIVFTLASTQDFYAALPSQHFVLLEALAFPPLSLTFQTPLTHVSPPTLCDLTAHDQPILSIDVQLLVLLHP